jgi:hypothetical protein
VRKEAADLFRAGTAAYERHEYRAAALAFEEAYRRVPRGAVLYNAGLAWQEAGEVPRAADAYASAVEDKALDEPSRKDASSRLSELEKSVGTVRVTEPKGESVAIGHVQHATIPVSVHLLPGPYALRLLGADGSSSTKTVVVTAGQTSVRTFDSPPAPPVVPQETPPSSTGSTLRVAGWIGLGTAVALSGAAIGLGLSAVHARDQFDASGDTDPSAQSRALTLRTLTNVAWGAAAVTGVAGIVLVLAAPRTTTSHASTALPVELRVGATTADCLVHF